MKIRPTVAVTATRTFPYPAERVFDAWLDVRQAKRWMFASADGEMVRAEIDPRVGGRFVFTDRREGEEVEHVGEYHEIDRPRRLVFTFGIPAVSPDMDVVTIDIVSTAEGCELTLRHEMDARWAEYADRSAAAWSSMLEAMEEALEEDGRGEGVDGPGPDQRRGAPDGGRGDTSFGELLEPDTLRFERSLAAPVARVWAYLTDSEHRARWLAAGRIDPRVGGRVELTFRNAELAPDHTVPETYRRFEGAVMTGTVTRWDPPHTLAFTWSESRDASEVTFELTATGGGDGTLLRIVHRRLTTPAELLDTAPGWHTHLDVLGEHLAGRTLPEPFWTRHHRYEAEYARRLSPEI